MNKLIYKLISIYYILASTCYVAIYLYGIITISLGEIADILFKTFLLAVSAVTLVLNVKPIFWASHDNMKNAVVYNKWLSALQVLNVKIFGVLYFLTFGTEFILYYVTKLDKYSAGYKFSMVEYKVTLAFTQNTESTILAINIFALAIFLYLLLTSKKLVEDCQVG